MTDTANHEPNETSLNQSQSKNSRTNTRSLNASHESVNDAYASTPTSAVLAYTNSNFNPHTERERERLHTNSQPTPLHSPTATATATQTQSRFAFSNYASEATSLSQTAQSHSATNNSLTVPSKRSLMQTPSQGSCHHFRTNFSRPLRFSLSSIHTVPSVN